MSTYRDPDVDKVSTLIRGASCAASPSDKEALLELSGLVLDVIWERRDERSLIAHLGLAMGTCRSLKVLDVIQQSLAILGVKMGDPERMRQLGRMKALLGESFPRFEEC